MWQIEKYHNINIKIRCLLPKTANIVKNSNFHFCWFSYSLEKNCRFWQYLSKRARIVVSALNSRLIALKTDWFFLRYLWVWYTLFYKHIQTQTLQKLKALPKPVRNLRQKRQFLFFLTSIVKNDNFFPMNCWISKNENCRFWQ